MRDSIIARILCYLILSPNICISTVHYRIARKLTSIQYKTCVMYALQSACWDCISSRVCMWKLYMCTKVHACSSAHSWPHNRIQLPDDDASHNKHITFESKSRHEKCHIFCAAFVVDWPHCREKKNFAGENMHAYESKLGYWWTQIWRVHAKLFIEKSHPSTTTMMPRVALKRRCSVFCVCSVFRAE